MRAVLRRTETSPPQQVTIAAFLGKIIRAAKRVVKQAASVLGKVARAVAPIAARNPGKRPSNRRLQR
jgi:hypothetical protein